MSDVPGLQGLQGLQEKGLQSRSMSARLLYHKLHQSMLLQINIFDHSPRNDSHPATLV